MSPPALVPGVALDRAGAALVVAAGRSRSSTRSCRRSLAALRLPFTVALGFLARPVARRRAAAAGRRRCCPTGSASTSFGDALLAVARHGGRRRRARGDLRDQRRRRVHAARDAPDRPPAGQHDRGPTCRGSSSWRSTGSPCRCCSARCATAARRRWRAGSPRTATGSRSGRPTCRRRPARARPGSCSAPTRTSARSAGSRRSTGG